MHLIAKVEEKNHNDRQIEGFENRISALTNENTRINGVLKIKVQ